MIGLSLKGNIIAVITKAIFQARMKIKRPINLINLLKNINQIIREQQVSYEVVFLIGKGRNGADGVAIARHLANQGVRTRAFVLFNENELCDILKTQLKIANEFGVAINYIENK